MFASPHNLGISRQLANIIALGCVLLTLTLVAIFSAGNLAVIAAAVGPLLLALVAAFKSTEAADTASRTHTVVEFTASQQAAIHQTLIAHCGDICPLENCALRGFKVTT